MALSDKSIPNPRKKGQYPFAQIDRFCVVFGSAESIRHILTHKVTIFWRTTSQSWCTRSQSWRTRSQYCSFQCSRLGGLGLNHTNEFLKTHRFHLMKTEQKICIHTSVFVSFSLRFHSSTLMRFWKRSSKREQDTFVTSAQTMVTKKD